jgi:hypothetical protein
MKNDYGHVRVVIDTNLYISLLIGKRLSSLLQVFDLPQYELVTSDSLINEILSVTARPKFAHYFNADDVQGFVQFLEEYSTKFRVDNIPQRCRDPKDDFLLELAIVSDADYLLSGDADLTDMKQIGHCRIMTVSEFLQTKG